MKHENEIMEKAGIELVSEEKTINSEIETRMQTRRKINRSMNNDFDSSNIFNCFKPEELKKARSENEYYLQRLLDLKKELSPFKDIEPEVKDRYEAGAIVYDSWGWEQTNVDFYCIVKRSGTFVTLLPMKSITSPEIGFMTNDETPGEIDFTADPVRKKIKTYEGKETGFSLRDYVGGGWVSLYEGVPVRSTHYA